MDLNNMTNHYYFIMGKESFFSHKESLGKIFKGAVYTVPPNQRDYDWGQELLEYFWEDLLNSYEQKDKSYFFGSVIFQEDEEDNKIIIYDGQQRMATLTILWAVIRNMLIKMKENENAQTIHTSYISQITEKKKETPILTLNLRNKNFFSECIQRKEGKTFDEYEAIHGKLNKSNDKIKKCYLFFEDAIIKEFENRKYASDKEKVNFITDISEHLRDHFILVIIYVGNEEEAYMIYEAINQKRLELSVADLFKNYLIRKTKDKPEKEQVIVIWKEIADSLDDEIRPFLKHYWHSKKGVITERRLFHELRKFIEKEKSDPFTLIKELGEESNIYSALGNPDDDFWDAGMKEKIRDFNTLGVEQPLPILMIAKKKFSEGDFKILLEAIISFSFRYNIICNFPPNVLERKYSDIARRIRGNLKNGETKIENTKQVLALLKEYYPNDEELEKKFVKKTIEKNKISLYIWTKINESLQQFEKPNRADLSVEHILPKKPDSEWEKYLVGKGVVKNDFDDLIYRIGNQTAMDVEMNTQAKNKFFAKKRDENYKDSKMPINEMLKSITDWAEKEITQREMDYVDIVKDIWKIEF